MMRVRPFSAREGLQYDSGTVWLQANSLRYGRVPTFWRPTTEKGLIIPGFSLVPWR